MICGKGKRLVHGRVIVTGRSGFREDGAEGFFQLQEAGLGCGRHVTTADLHRDLSGVAVQVSDQNRLNDLVEGALLL